MSNFVPVVRRPEPINMKITNTLVNPNVKETKSLANIIPDKEVLAGTPKNLNKVSLANGTAIA